MQTQRADCIYCKLWEPASGSSRGEKMPTLAVVIGDPTGIGPEVLAKALVAGLPADVLLIGDALVWSEAQKVAGVSVPAIPAHRPGSISGGVPFLDLPPEERIWKIGEVSPAAGRAAAAWLERAVRLAVEGVADAVVFAPLNKQAIIRGGYAVRDEYDLVGTLAQVDDHDEMNVIPHPAGGDLLWVARVTSHVALREVPSLLTPERVLRTIRLAHRVATGAGMQTTLHSARGSDPTAVARMGQVFAPRIGVAALNPHAGEGGILGDEEARVIAPAIEAARVERIDATGPYPADHIFRLARAGHLDVIVSMYHDQAQIATKLLGFERGVSVGVGYPFVMTTPSHGTAFDIAGRGVADARPMAQALTLALRLAASRQFL